MALAVLGGTRERQAERAVDDYLAANMDQLTPDQEMSVREQGDAFIADQGKRGRLMLGLGAGLAGLGAVGVGVGAYLLVRARKGPSRVSLAPQLAPGRAGLVLSGRF